MRINNIYLTNLPVDHAEGKEADAPERPEGAPAVTPGVSAHVPSAELTGLLEQVRNTPEVRQELLAEIARRMADGYYLTSEAAERAADAILNAPEAG